MYDTHACTQIIVWKNSISIILQQFYVIVICVSGEKKTNNKNHQPPKRTNITISFETRTTITFTNKCHFERLTFYIFTRILNVVDLIIKVEKEKEEEEVERIYKTCKLAFNAKFEQVKL